MIKKYFLLTLFIELSFLLSLQVKADEKDNAATKIQAIVRGNQLRKKIKTTNVNPIKHIIECSRLSS